MHLENMHLQQDPSTCWPLKVAPLGGPFVLEKNIIPQSSPERLWNGTDSVKLQHPIHL